MSEAAQRAGAGELIDLADEAATRRLAARSRRFRPGRRFSRAVRRSRRRQDHVRPRLPARAAPAIPSSRRRARPSRSCRFTTAPDFPVVHADFYRLRGADELAPIGWDEAIDGAVVVVEWPERAAAALPPDRLEIALTFDLARGADLARRRRSARFGAIAPRWARARAIERLLQGVGWGEAGAGCTAWRRLDARLSSGSPTPNGASAILMISPPRPDGPIVRYGKSYGAIAKLSPDIRAFLAMAEGLRALGYSTPARLRPQRRRRSGADRGLRRRDDRRRRRRPTRRATPRRRRCSPTCMIATCRANCRSTARRYALPVYDIEAMLVEVELALDWYAPAIARITPAMGARMQFLGLWRDTLTAAARRADDLDAARLSFAQSPLARRARGIAPPRPDRLPGRRAGAARLRRRLAAAGRADRGRRRTRTAGCWRSTPACAARPIRSSTPQAFAGAYAIDGRAARDQDPRHLHPARPARRQAAISAAAAAHRAAAGARTSPIPCSEPLRLWYQTHLPRALGEGAPPSAEP